MKKTLYILFGCVLLLAATVLPGKAANGIIDTLYYSICSGDTITVDLHQTPVYESTVLYDTIPGASAAEDSIHMYVVTLYPKFRHVEHRDLVPGQHFEWQGMVIQSAGTYTKVYKSVTGCDSTYVMVVSEKQGVQLEFHSMKTIPFCDSIDWNGTMYRESHIFVDTLRSLRYGCDSIVTTALEKGISFRKYDTDSLVLGETLLWHGLSITEGGDYLDKHTSIYGCDSTYVLHVEMIPALEIHPRVVTTHEDICEGDAFEWRGLNRSQTGTYYDTAFVNGTEIDSLFVLHLQVHSPSTTTEMVSFSTFPQQYRGETITGPGIYSVSYLSSFGCDSTIRIIVNRQAIVHEESATICAGEEYIWRQKHLREEQTYYETVKAKDGTDSVSYIMHLHVRSIPETHITRTICNGDSYMFGNQLLTEAGVYRHAYKTEGCDSVVVLSLNIADVDTIVQVRRLEAGSTYTWPANGYTYSKAGTYEVRETNRFGCDSIVRLVLTVNHVDTIDTVATICPGDRLVWHTIDASQTGHYENVETDPHGDMRYYRLDLTVRDLTEQEVRFTICGDESITFNGKQYSQAGHYYDKGSCDTLYHIIVTQDPLRVYTTNANWDGVNPYVWHFMHNGVAKDSAFAVAGTYEFKSPNPDTGCNDIWRLILRQDANDYHFVEQVTLCESELFSWRGLDNLSLVPGDAVYKQEYKTISGRDSIYELQVKVLPLARSNKTITFCGSTVWKGVEYTQSAMVYDTLTAANGCDSIITVSLRHVDPFFRRDTATIVQGEQLIWHGQTITTDGVYQDKKVNQFGCDSVYELHVGIQAAAPQTNMITEMVEICEGDYYEWRGHKYYNKGLYPDTVFAQTIEERDTIYVLNLDVRAVVRRHEQYSFCEEETLQSIYGVNYNNKVKTGEVYRDTVTVLNPNNAGCPDTVYIEIFKYPVTKHTEVQTLLASDTMLWHEQTITRPGTYKDEKEDGGLGGCKTIDYLRVVADSRKTVFVCVNDTAVDVHPDKKYPYFWEQTQEYYYTTGIWTDTVFDTEGLMKEFYSLDLTITQPYDTTIYVHGCDNKGAWWRDQHYDHDTTFVERVETLPYNPKQPCDSVFHVHIKIDKTYKIRIDTTLCEYQLPFIVGRVNPDTVWWEGDFRHESDSTVCGCDSIIEGHLTIIPKLSRNDSTFVCEDFLINGGSVTLGDTVHPAFIENDGGKWADKWQGKWTGVHYTEDTIVWDCDHRYFHHIFVRPSQKQPYDTTYYLCKGDSVQLFWPKPQMVKEAGVYLDTVPSGYEWTDAEHGYTYTDQQYVCDSVTRWTVKYVYPEQKDTTVHKLLGDSIWWGGNWRYYTGTYDSIGTAQNVNSDGMHCQLTYTLHLVMDTAYYFRDTVDVCTYANKTLNHTWFDGHVQSYTVGLADMNDRHYVDSLITYDRRDSIYDLSVNYRIVPTTHLFDTICEDTPLRWDEHHRDNSFTERYLSSAGVYYDTIPGVNICDSVLIMHLYMRDRIPATHQEVTISDREIPYLWVHTWPNGGNDTTVTDTLRSSGEYMFVMPSIHGCDSIDSLSFRVHETHVFRDTITVCEAINTTRMHVWFTGYEQEYTTPLADMEMTYSDTLQTRILFDSIYVLNVNFHQTYLTELLDTICEGDRYRFDLHKGNNTTERWLETAGTYWDTVETRFGCDSVIKLRLYVRDRIPVTHTTVHIPDTAAPYQWVHRWTEGGQTKDSTQVLNVTGEYTFVMPSIYGCDSIDSLHLFIHKTYLIPEDTIVICHNETPFTWQDRNDITESCDLTFHALTTEGYDSIRTVHIEVLPESKVSVLQSMCEGDFYKFGDSILTEQGVYIDTLKAVNGCDSIVTLTLQVNPVGFQTEYKRIFEGDSAFFDGTWYKESGVYEKRTLNANNCTETYQFVLTVLKASNIDTTAYVCQNELPYTWHGYEYSEAGDFVLPILWNDSARVTMTLHLHVNPTFYGERNVSLCAQDTFVFKGKNYMDNCTFYDTIPSLVGCDSIIKYIISVHPTYDKVIEKHISDKEPFIFHDRVLSNSGTYEWTGKTINGCDSLEHLILTVHPSFFISDTVDLCQSDSVLYPYKWHGYEISQSGTYSDTTLTTYGFDSICQLVIHIHPAYFTREQYEIGEGEVLKIHGRDISKPAIYYDTLRTFHGCDSIFHVVVNPKRTREFTWTKEICQGEYYEFLDGRKLTHTGNYTYTSQYKDSIVYLHLTVKPTSVSEKRIVITDKKDYYTYDGQIYEHLHMGDNLFVDTLRNQYGCDSIKRLVICMTTRYSEWIPIPLCPGTDVRIDGQIITEAGLYMFERRSRVTGEMDSLYRVEVYDAPAYDFPTERRTICDGDTTYFAGKALTRGGHYDFALKTVDGCDSLLHLDLTVNKSYHFVSDATIADYETYNWLGKAYTETGVYDRTWPTIDDCDSTYTLRLTVVPTVRDTITETICNGQSYTWRGKVYTVDGYYTDTVRMLEGNFSAIYAMRLIVAYPTLITSARAVDYKEGEDEIEVSFTYTGQRPTQYSILFDTHAKKEGFEDIYDAPLYEDNIATIPIPQRTGTCYNGKPTYIRPDWYSMRLVLDNGVCGQSRSDSMSFLIKYPSWIIEQNWDDVVAPLKPECNCGYEFSHIEWYVNDKVQPNNGLGYLHNDALEPGDKVVMSAIRKGENYAIPTQPLVIQAVATPFNEYPIIVYPTQVPRHTPIVTIEAPSEGRYEVFSSTGVLVSSGMLEEGKTQVTLPGNNGIYFIRAIDGDAISSHKVLIY